MSQAIIRIRPMVEHPPLPHGTSKEFGQLLRRWALAAGSFHRLPATRRTETVAQRFRELVDLWRSEQGPSSSVSVMAMHPAYQQIIGMGRSALPLLLKELDEDPDHWFWALTAITGVDPIAPAHRGDLHGMSADWLQWARDEGLRW